MKEKTTKPKILSVTRADSYVEIRREVARSSEQQTTPDPKKPGETKTKVVTSSSEFKEKSHEAPLPPFDDRLQALSGVACNILGVPPSWAKGVTVVGLSLSYTESGIRTAVVSLTKSISATGGLHPLKTPAFQIDDGKKADEGRRQCAKQHADDVVAFIKEAQRYVEGERSQQLLDFEDEGEEGDDDKTSSLPGINDKQD